jgi:hypothetical protein
MSHDRSVDEMVTGSPSVDTYARRAIHIYVISCFATAAVLGACLLWLLS